MSLPGSCSAQFDVDQLSANCDEVQCGQIEQGDRYFGWVRTQAQLKMNNRK